MKTYRKEVKITEHSICTGRTCDLCGLKSKNEDWQPGKYGYSYSTYDDTEITIKIKHRQGTSYPEGGSGDEIEIDLCPSCFRNRLVVWLKEQGANIDYVDLDW